MKEEEETEKKKSCLIGCLLRCISVHLVLLLFSLFVVERKHKKMGKLSCSISFLE